MIDFQPILVVPAVPDGDGIVFLHRDRQINIGKRNADLVWKILRYCNGYHSIEMIACLSGTEKNEVQEILESLLKLEVLVDSREQYRHFHRLSSYPNGYLRNLTQKQIAQYTDISWRSEKKGLKKEFPIQDSFLRNLIAHRRSCRSFSEEKLTGDIIASICHYAYHIPNHSVPSGGALYPLHIYALVETAQNDIDPGYYEYDAMSDNLVQFRSEVDIEVLKFCFNSVKLPFDSFVQIIIAADLDRQPYKYSNRGYRLTLIEAGHAAENICLFCAEQNIGTCELGGILDEALRDELEIDSFPLIGIAIGKPGEDKRELNRLSFVEEMIADDKPVFDVWCQVLEHRASFYGATTVYREASGEKQYAGATSTSYEDACFKATVEGYERWMSGQVRTDFYGTAEELRSKGIAWIGADELAPLTAEQCEKAGLKLFTTSLPIRWTEGKSVDGKTIYVPADIVFYGQPDIGNRIYYSHSSGIAAHFKRDWAVYRGLDELIERDAIMRGWFLNTAPKQLCSGVLPFHAQRRIEYWQTKGREVRFLEMPSDYGEVIETVVFSDSWPYFVCGAAATIDPNKLEQTIIKALQEAEYNLVLAMDNQGEIIEPESVRSPADHGNLYHRREYAEKLKWLLDGQEIRSFSLEEIVDPVTLMRNIGAIFVDLGERNGLKVVRVLSPMLVPINFGCYTAHYTHPAVAENTKENKHKLPHYFS